MKVLILTTREFDQFFVSDKWEKLQCDNAKSMLQTIGCDDLLGERLVLLKRIYGDSCFYVMPCIPKKYYVNPQNSFIELEKRQDYIGCIITDVLQDLNLPENSDDEIRIVAHDRDLYDETNERPLFINEVKSPTLKNHIQRQIRLENIHGFQHLDEPREWRVNPVITDYLSKPYIDENIMEMFINKIERRKRDFMC